MSEFSAPGSSMPASPLMESSPGHGSCSDLAELSLPATFRDEFRKLAWVDSICFVFLVIGLIGIKAPQVVVKPVNQPVDVVPVVFVPPPEQPKIEPDQKPDEAPPTEEVSTPQVVTVVAPNPAAVAFAVPVQGPVVVAQAARLATPPPPPQAQAEPGPTKFDPNAMSAGRYPPPNYPLAALRNHYEGTVDIELRVDPSGTVTSVKLMRSSGYPVLDEAALQVVKTRWRFPPGEARYLTWSCSFELH